MATTQEILMGLLLPGAIAAVLAMLGFWLARGSPVGAIVGFCIGLTISYHTFKGNLPTLKPTEAAGRTVLVALIVGIISVIICFAKVPTIVRMIITSLVAPTVVVWFIISKLPEASRPEAMWQWIAGLSAAAVLIVGSTEWLGKVAGPTAAAFVLGPFAAGAGLLLSLSGSAQAGKICLSAAVMVLGWFLASLTHRKAELAHGAVCVCMVPLAGLLSYDLIPKSNITLPEIALLSVSPLLAWIAQIPPISRLRPWKKELVRLAIVATPIIIAVILAAIAFHKASLESSSMEM